MTGITLYRGIDGSQLNFDEHCKVGNTLTWPAFTSTSLNEDIVYKQFLVRVARPVIFEIQGDFVGYNIKKFSRFQEEDEVLLEPETMFRIVSIEKDKRNESVTRIVVAVQKSPLLINEAVENFRKAEQEYKIKQMRQQQQQQPLTTSDNTQTGSANQPTKKVSLLINKLYHQTITYNSTPTHPHRNKQQQPPT